VRNSFCNLEAAADLTRASRAQRCSSEEGEIVLVGRVSEAARMPEQIVAGCVSRAARRAQSAASFARRARVQRAQERNFLSFHKDSFVISFFLAHAENSLSGAGRPRPCPLSSVGPTSDDHGGLRYECNAARSVDGTLKTHFHEQCGEETKAREGPSFGCRSSLSACGAGAPGRRGLKYAATPRAATENVSLIALSFYSGAI
jgi:hypothetical protein